MKRLATSRNSLPKDRSEGMGAIGDILIPYRKPVKEEPWIEVSLPVCGDSYWQSGERIFPCNLVEVQ